MLSTFSPPSSGKQGLLLNRFSIELTVQCEGCLIWGPGWQAGLVAGLRVGQAYGVFHRPGFGLLVSVPRSLSTQTPFATQLLILLVPNGHLISKSGFAWRAKDIFVTVSCYHGDAKNY